MTSPIMPAMLPRIPIEDLVCGLRKLTEADFQGVTGTLNFLRAHPVAPDSLAPYLFWNSQHYTRNLIEKNELFELLAICWEAGMRSSIHNHRGQNCWMCAPLGRLAVQNYRVVTEDLSSRQCDIVPTNIVDITPDQPVAVDPVNPVHDVQNPRELNQRAVSLHVYSHPFDSCIVYSVEQHTCGEIGLKYTSKFGKKV